MDFRQTLLLYLLLGAGVAIGYAARTPDKGRAWATILAAWVFWPLFVPLLLSAEEEPPTPVSEPRNTRIARYREQLDRLAATAPALGLSHLPEQVARIQSRWTERVAWLMETNLLIQNLKATHTPVRPGTMAPQTPQIEELQRLQHSTEQALERSLSGINELAVQIQLLKAPGVDRTAELECIERVLKAMLELETAEEPSMMSSPE
jgi:hypothetical protein